MNIIDKILDVWENHKKAVIAVAIMLLVLIISGAVANGFKKSNKEAKDAVTKVENNIESVEEQLKQPVTKYKELDHGYRQSRVDRDQKILEGKGTGVNGSNEWLSRFLTWSSGAEYEENRLWFIEKLGASNPFVTDVMRSYNSSDIGMENNQTIDANAISCKLTKTEFYVDSIDASTDVYHYVIIATFDAKSAYSNSAFNAMDRVMNYIIMVSVDADGNVLADTFIATSGPTYNN